MKVIGNKKTFAMFMTVLFLMSAITVFASFTPPVSAQLADTPWPMFRFDPSHTGTTPEVVLPPLTLKWSYTTGGGISSSPAVSGGMVYIGSGDNHVYALDAATGALKWKYMTGGGISSSPAVSGGMVYIGSYDYNVYALDAATGALKWSYTTYRMIESSPAVSDGVVYIGSNDDHVYALDAATGALKWSYTTRDFVRSSPAVSGGVVYVGSYESGHGVYALDAATGALKWEYTTPTWVESSPAVSGGVVYVGSWEGNVYALDAATGALKWSSWTGGELYSSPAVSGGMVYIGSGTWRYDINAFDYNVYALDAATGALKWSYTTGARVRSSPAVSGGVVYVGSNDAKIYALDAATGALKWSYTTGGGISSSPAVSGGMVYVGSSDNKVYAFATIPKVPWYGVVSTDETGRQKNVFDIPETVYVSGRGYSSSTTYDLYIVEDTTLGDGMDIPARVLGTETSVTTDASGSIPAGTVAWNGPLTPGKYDIVIDVNGNGRYDEGIDAIDDDDIKVTAGFFVIPELPLGTVTALLAALTALTLFKKRSLMGMKP